MLNLSEAKTQFDQVVKNFKDELKQIRAGRPSPDMFKDIKVQAYGSETDLNSVANINIVDATLVTVQPWDKNLVEAVEKAIQKSDKGFNPQVSGELVRIPIPAMTQEKRKEYADKVNQLTEEARIKVRQIRKEVLQKLDKDKKSGDLPEDQYFRKEKQLQEKVDEVNEELEEISEKKVESIMKV